MTGSELALWREELIATRSDSELVDRLLSPSDAPLRLRTFPGEQLYRLIRRIGLEDCIELLPMASPDQVRACLDFDIWAGDEVSLERLDPWLNALMHAGPEILVSRMRALDDQLLSLIVQRSVQVEVIEDPNSFEAPDLEHVLTQDRRLCLVFPEPGERDLPIKVFLDTLMRDDAEFCYNFLIFTGASLATELQETAYRWRQGRLADLGFVDRIEALGLYTAPRPDQIAEARRAVPPGAEPAVLAPSLRGDERLAAALARMDGPTTAVVLQELVYVCNTALSADGVPLWDDEGQALTLRRVRAGLSLGLDALSAEPGAEGDARVLDEVPLALVFRTGYARTLEAAEPARAARRRGRLVGPGGPVDALDPPLLRRWAEAITDRHPHVPDAGPPRTSDDLSRIRGFAELLADLVDFPCGERPEEAGLCAWVLTQLVRPRLGLQGYGPLSEDRLADAHRLLFVNAALRDDTRQVLLKDWKAGGGRAPHAVQFLLTWAGEELGHVPTDALEARFCSVLFLGE